MASKTHLIHDKGNKLDKDSTDDGDREIVSALP